MIFEFVVVCIYYDFAHFFVYTCDISDMVTSTELIAVALLNSSSHGGSPFSLRGPHIPGKIGTWGPHIPSKMGTRVLIIPGKNGDPRSPF